MTPDERELVLQLLDDVSVIEDQFRSQRPKPATVRTVLVPILRRWIVEQLFYRTQKMILPQQVCFPIRRHQHFVDLCRRGVYVHWMGLIEFEQVGVGAGQIAPRYLGPDGPTVPIKAPESDNEPAPQRARAFFEQKMFFWKGEFYRRHDVIIMHANALGGVHLNFRRRDDEQHINEIKNYFGFEVRALGNNKNLQMLKGQDIASARADPGRRPNVYDATELVAMDTARIFAQGIRASMKTFTDLLA